MQAPYPVQPSAPPSVAQCVTRVQMNISCRNLQDKDVMSKSDPMAVVMMLKDGSWFEVNSVHLFINYPSSYEAKVLQRPK